ncbi:MAG: ATP-dependent zinc metalloprotease FtsH [Candidatus Coproplasma sp.]
MNKKSKIVMWVVIALLSVAAIAVIVISTLNGGAKQISYSEIRDYANNAQYYAEDGVVYTGTGENKQVAEGYSVDAEGYITYNGERIVVLTKIQFDQYKLNAYVQRNGKDVMAYYCYSGSFYSDVNNPESQVNVWADYGIAIEYTNPNSGSVWSTVISYAGLIIMCVVFWLIIRSTAGGAGKAMSFAKTKARVTTNIKVRFSDVAGAEEEKVELAEVVEFLKQPKKFSDLGARIPKGVLLVGPPGTGKTLFAKAVAGEAGVPFFSVSGSDFVEMYVGVGASRVRDLFEMAKKNQPCIIFIDEIDAVGRHRGAGLGGGNDEREQTLNQILVQMDGFESNEGVIVIAATNRADILDPALMRPGRFDRQVYVNLPDVKGREQILKVHARNKPMAQDVNFKTVARLTVGFSGADLANLLNEAAILAARADKKFITNAELFESIDKITMGPAKKSKVVTESDKRLTAFHESGHCILAKLCPNCDPVHEVTIIPRGNAGGFTMTRPESDRAYYSRNYLLDDICMGLGGRVAEELVIHDISSGAMGDIKQATKFARAMVCEFGMSEKLGLVCYNDDSQPVFIGKDMATQNPYSEETAKLIDDEVREIIATQHERARKLLSENRSVLDNMARVLIERETIYTEEVDMLLEGKSYAEVIAYMDEHDNESHGNPFKRFEQ